MTRFRSSVSGFCLLLTACATSSGVPAARIAEPAIAASYLPLHARIHMGLTSANGAAVVIAPGIAVTNAHNADLVDPKQVIGQVSDYDLLYFRTPGRSVAADGEPVAGAVVTAYGQGVDSDLRIAHGVVREIANCAGCTTSAYFTFAGNAGPGFSGGPVVDAAGRLVGITFGYKDEGGTRLIYAYAMSRVRAEFSALPKRPD
jgi:hypothetical protein